MVAWSDFENSTRGHHGILVHACVYHRHHLLDPSVSEVSTTKNNGHQAYDPHDQRSRVKSALTFVIVVISSLISCKPSQSPPAAIEISVEKSVDLQTTAAKLEANHPSWKEQRLKPEAQPDDAVLAKLAAVTPGAQIDIYLGSWCGDSRREVARFFNVLDHPSMANPPFTVRLYDLDRGFQERNDFDQGLIAVPTFVVTRDGHEVGRVVETSPTNIETELLRLLSGESQGMISATR